MSKLKTTDEWTSGKEVTQFRSADSSGQLTFHNYGSLGSRIWVLQFTGIGMYIWL